MAVKYQCPNCERRFVDWGAEKLGFKCPECKDSELLRLGSADDVAKAAPTLKRKSKPAQPVDTEEVLTSVDEKDDAVEGVIGDDDIEDLDAGDGEAPIDDEPLD